MKRLSAFTLLVVMLFTMILSSCGTSDNNSSSTASTGGTSSTGSTSSTGTNETADEDLAFRKFDEPLDVHIGYWVNPTDTTLPDGDSAGDNQYTRYLLENYNINVIMDWTAATGNDYQQKVSLCIASDTLPDGLIAPDESYLRKAANSGMLKDITELFQQYASEQVQGIMDTTEGRAIDNVSFDGVMMALPNVSVATDGVYILNVRKDWLDMYGLDIPKTVDDIENIGKVFLEEQPAGSQTIALTGPDKNGLVYSNFLESGNASHSFDPVFNAYDAYPGFWLDNGDGTVSYGTLSDNTRDALERLASWYQMGIIDPEMGTRDQSIEPVNANEAGMWFSPWWGLGYGNGDSFVNDETANWQSYPIYDDEGNWNIRMKNIGTTSTMISVDASDDVAAAIIIMYNALVRDESTFDTSVAIDWYPLRNTVAALDETEYEQQELMKVLEGETDPEDYNDPMSIYKNMYSDALTIKETVPGYESGRDLNVEDFSMENRGNFNRAYAILIGDRPFATTEPAKEVYSVTYAMTETMEKKWSNLKTMEEEVMLKIITGQSDISAFDQFVEDWKSQGGDDITLEVQELLNE